MLMNSVVAVSAEFFSLLLLNDFWLHLTTLVRVTEARNLS